MYSYDLNDALRVLHVKNDDKPCRICLTTTDNNDAVFVFEARAEKESPAHLIETLTGITLLSDSYLPSFICKTCLTELKVAVSFKFKLEYTNDLLTRASKIVRHSTEDDSLTNDWDSIKEEGFTIEDEITTRLTASKSEDDPGVDSNLEVKKKKSKIYKCTQCDYTTSKLHYVVIHGRSHTGERPFSCKLCHKSFSQKATLWSHQKTHSDTTYFTCPECGYQFKHKSAFNRHISRAHSLGGQFQCSICKKFLKSAELLNMHTLRHMNVKSYSCETCGKCFVTKPELIRHQVTHLTVRKMYECSICHHRSSSKSNLTAHVRAHSGEKPFVCDKCPVSCRSNAQLNIHKRKHSKISPYSCLQCESKFRYSNSLNRHMSKAHGAVNFSHGKTCDRRVVK